MIVAMKADATKEEIQQVIERISSYGLNALNMPGGERTAIGIASAIPTDLREPLAEILQSMPGVDHVTHVSRAYKLASREFHPIDTIVQISGLGSSGEAESPHRADSNTAAHAAIQPDYQDVVSVGGNEVVIAAGPCAVENLDQMLESARIVKKCGGRILRGGAFKPRTNPYSFQGLGIEGLKLLKAAGQSQGLVTVTEIVDQHDLDIVLEYADVLQIGARNMQNYTLLTAVGKVTAPVVLKRGPAATIDEWLLAAEYILSQGNTNVILCERGVHPLDREYTRYTLDISAVPVVKSLSHLPVIVDPSHASGNWQFVAALAKAAIAAGADGLLMEVHPNPSCALCDGRQSLKPDKFAALMRELRSVASAIGRTLAPECQE